MYKNRRYYFLIIIIYIVLYSFSLINDLNKYLAHTNTNISINNPSNIFSEDAMPSQFEPLQS